MGLVAIDVRATSEVQGCGAEKRKSPRSFDLGLFYLYLVHPAGFEPTTPAFGVLKVDV